MMRHGEVQIEHEGGDYRLLYEFVDGGVYPIRYEHNGFADVDPPMVIEDKLVELAYDQERDRYRD